MRRQAQAVLALTGVAVGLAISLASCGTAGSTRARSTGPSGLGGPSGRGAPSRLSVTPSTGTPRTEFSLRFTAPASSGRVGSSRLGFSLSLTGPVAGGCISGREVSVPSTTKGTPVQIAVDPARLGGVWCLGTYTARVFELETPFCAPGNMCPQFVRVLGIVGTASFRVRDSS